MSSRPLWSLSFSGAGHLLTYHLGVAKTLVKSHDTFIKQVSGSSSGAIAAAALCCFSPKGMEEFTSRFIQDGGRALQNFEQVLFSELQESPLQQQNTKSLGIATTKCDDGSLRIFSFDINRSSQIEQQERIVTLLKASCFIPRSFHPWDAFTKFPVSYPDGIDCGDGKLYCDGGIAAPAPFLHDETIINTTTRRVLISPISGSSTMADFSIRPSDDSIAVPLFDSLLTTRCGTYTVRPSVQNLQALITSAGVVTSPQVLKDWHDRGVNDAMAFLETWDRDCSSSHKL